jgi:hypothetical protein
MTLPTYYATGTASVNNGATTVTGTGTGWAADSFGTPVIEAGDFFMDPAQPEIPPQRIASVTDATHLVLARPWPGVNVSGPYEVQFVGDIVRSTAQTRRYLERLGQLAAFGIQPNAFGNFADRSAFDGEVKGYIFLSLNGDGVSNVWTLYIKRSAAAGDWEDGQSLMGPGGEQGETGLVAEWLGPWVAGTYPPLKGVTHNGSSYISKIETSQEPPHADWDVVAAKGDPGDNGADGADGTNGTNGTNGTDGKFNGAEVVKTAAYMAVATDVGKTFILDKATADTLSFDLAAALGASWMVMVKNIGAGTWSLDPTGSETIDGAATISLAQGESAVVSCNGTTFRSLFRGSATAGGLPQAGGDMTGPIGFVGPSAVLNDRSAVVGSAGAFFYPDYFGNAGSGIVHRLNRLLVGVAAFTSSDTPPDNQDWLETLAGSTTRGAQLAAISAIGNLGVLGAARSSDFRTWAGAATGGSQGVTGFGWNDDTGAGNPIAVGGEFRGFRKAGVTGITVGAQISGGNEGSTVDITPSGGVVAGSTMALLLTNGPAPSGYVNPISAAMVIGSGALSAVSRKGLIVLADSLDTSIGGGGAGIAMEVARSQSLRWLNNASGVDAELWGNANGLNISGTARIGAALANYYTISGSASTQPVLSVDGSATDIDLVLQSKGLGVNMLRKTDTQTAAVSIAAQLRHLLSSGTAAVGIGVGQNFVVPNAAGSNKIVATEEAVATNVGNGTENADLVWKLMAAGAAAAEKLRLKSTGELNLATGGSIAVNGTKVVGARDTGWGGMTGSADKATAYATGTVTLAQLAGRVMAIQAALTTHGLLGA